MRDRQDTSMNTLTIVESKRRIAYKPQKGTSKRSLGVGVYSSSKPHKSSRQGKIKPKTKTVSKLKKELDAVFSKYIRAKHPKKCFTCGKVSDKLQCGHFVPRIYLATRWEEDNCRPQDVGCNIWGRGQLLDFEENLIKEIGVARVQQLKEKRNEIWKLTPEWYQKNIALYTQKLNHLIEELKG